MKPKLCIAGSYFGQTGYAVHTQQLALALSEYYDVAVDTEMPPDWVSRVNDKNVEFFNKNYREEVTICIMQPWLWPLILSDKPKKFIGYLVWEGDKIPKAWIKNILDPRVDEIWVPSEHTKQAIIKTLMERITPEEWLKPAEKIYGYSEPPIEFIKVVPHGVDLEIFKPLPKPDGRFVFFANKGWCGTTTDRGGIQYLLKAYNEEFTSKDNVKLIIKINIAYTGKIDFTPLIKKIIEKREDSPELNLCTDALDYHVLNQLYNSAHCFVSPSRAEAFGINMVESMAAGLPVITTNYGGQTDFVNQENGWLISGELVNANEGIEYEGIKWLEPSVEELRKIMRYAYEHQEEVKSKGIKALETAEKYTWKNTALIAKSHLDKLYDKETVLQVQESV